MMKAKKVVLLSAAAAVVVASLMIGRVTAQSSTVQMAAGPTAVCNVGEVFNRYQRARDLLDQFRQAQQDLQDEDQRRQEELNQMRVELEAYAKNSPEYISLVESMQKKLVERNVYVESEKARLNFEQRRNIEMVYDTIVGVISDVAAAQGYQLVLQQNEMRPGQGTTEQFLAQVTQRRVLYRHPQIDITDTVLEQLNAEYGTSGQ